jgi:hypothetical protein
VRCRSDERAAGRSIEEPVAALLKQIEALSLPPQTDASRREIEASTRVSPCAPSLRLADAWQQCRSPAIRAARLERFIERLFTGFVEIHGDRRLPMTTRS